MGVDEFRRALKERIPDKYRSERCTIMVDLDFENLRIEYPGTNIVLTIKESDIDPRQFLLELDDGDECLAMDHVKKGNLIYKVGLIIN